MPWFASVFMCDDGPFQSRNSCSFVQLEISLCIFDDFLLSTLHFEFVIPSFFFFFFKEITLDRCWISWPGPLNFLYFLFHVLLSETYFHFYIPDTYFYDILIFN